MPQAVEDDKVSMLLGQLRGRELKIPNLRALVSHWPLSVNQNLEKLRPQVDEMLEHAINDPKKLQKLKGHDFAHFAALLYPECGWERLRVAATFIVWMFVWDDDMDMRGSAYSDDLELGRAHRKITLEYISWALGLEMDENSSHGASLAGTPPCCGWVTARLFGDFGAAMREGATEVVRRRLYDELAQYISQVAVEQERRLENYIPTPKEYVEMRLGTSAAYTFSAFFEFMHDVDIPDSTIMSRPLREMCYEANIMTILINDLYSLKKELDLSLTTSIVPVDFWASKKKCLDTIVNELLGVFLHSSKAFDIAAAEALVSAGDDSCLRRSLEIWIRNCRAIVTGGIEYHLKSKRYGIQSFAKEDGSTVLIL